VDGSERVGSGVAQAFQRQHSGRSFLKARTLNDVRLFG
jgi:hypothetical protein